MNKFFYLLLFLFLFEQSLSSNPCTKIKVNPFLSNEIYIERYTNKCAYFAFDNPSDGN